MYVCFLARALLNAVIVFSSKGDVQLMIVPGLLLLMFAVCMPVINMTVLTFIEESLFLFMEDFAIFLLMSMENNLP